MLKLAKNTNIVFELINNCDYIGNVVDRAMGIVWLMV